MIDHSHLWFHKKIYESPRTIVLRARGKRYNFPVIIKKNNSLTLNYQSDERLEFEHSLLNEMNSKNVIRTLGWERLAEGPAIVLEDIGGVSLDRLPSARPLALRDGLTIALGIAEALQEVHTQRIIHKDVNPSNIVWNQDTSAVKLIDFGAACRKSVDPPEACPPNVADIVEGCLDYISPEQTGRTDQALDYRTDFYSLGATLYELLTGHRPFASADPMEIVHAHIARRPEPPGAINPAVPETVSAIILKLMEKRPEDRYQSAFGLKHDLNACLRHLEMGEVPKSFVPGSADLSSRFIVSQKLYGRETEVGLLMAARRRARLGAFEIALVGGYSGVGKTSLVREIEKPTKAPVGHFVAGKFDPQTTSIPYYAFRQALTALASQLLGQGDDGVEHWRRRLLDALGVNGEAALEVVPELVHIIGPQPPIPALPPQDALNRANLVLRQLIKAFAGGEHPLTVFLDDLQWADPASLQLLVRLSRDTEINHLFIVGTYRDNEVDAAHPLSTAMEDIRDAPVTLTEMTVLPLDHQHVAQLIADSLSLGCDGVSDLTEACTAKTLGNPFFLNQLLRSLHKRGFITFDAVNGRWNWDKDSITAAEISENVIDLMVEKICGFPDTTRSALKFAACIGVQFDLDTLAALCGRSIEETAGTLSDLAADSLILPLDGTPYDTLLRHAGRSVVRYQFVHDRVREAASSLIDEAQKTSTRLKIGRLLLDRLTQDQIGERIFEIVNHLNAGIGLLDVPMERLGVAQLNLRAGKKAKASAATSTAFDYIVTGLSLLPEDAWVCHYDLTMALHEEAAEAAYLVHRYDAMEDYLERLMANAVTTLDTARAVELRILAVTASGRLKEAVDIGVAFLEQLGFHYPNPASGEDVAERLRQVQMVLADRSIERLAEMPEMTDPTAQTAMRTLNALAAPAYNAAPELFLCMVFTQVELFVRHGNSADAAVAYSTYALALCAVAEQFDDGDAFGRLAFKVAERFKADHLKARIHLNIYTFVHHRRHHLAETLAPLSEGYRIGLVHGDQLFAALNAHVACHHRLFTAAHLADAEELMAANHGAIAKLDQRAALTWTAIFWQMTQNLMGRAEDPLALVGDAFNEEENAHLFEEKNDKTLVFVYHFNKLMISTLLEDQDQAYIHAQLSEKYIHSVIGIVHVPMCRFYATITRLKRLDMAEGDERDALMSAIVAHKAEIERWAESAPMNHAHKTALLEAEIQRVQGEREKAATLYDTAATLASENGYPGEAALANELAGRFYLESGRRKVARLYLGDAVRGYRQWGALAKVRQLEGKYRDLLAQGDEWRAAATATGPSSHRDISRDQLDLASALKASQAISAEIVLDRLLDSMMRTVMENAGAERGFLIRAPDAGHLHVWVEAEVGNQTRIRSNATPPDEEDRLSTAIVNYVTATDQSIILKDAANDGLFTSDLYVVENKPKSILCLPLKNRGNLIAVLYLENNLTTDAFTPRHLALLDLLTGQMAISIENAKLYEGLEERVAERTMALEEKVGELSRAYKTVRNAQIQLEAQAVELQNAKEVAEAANRSKSSFLASISHELRTPLNSILGFSEILRDESIGPVGLEMVRDYAASINEGGQHLLGVINDLLDLAKIEAGRLELEPEPVEIAREIAACVRLVANRATDNGLTLAQAPMPDVPTLVADRRALRQMLFNLLSNAIKFTPPGGSVDISCRPDVGGGIRIAVADTGMGIDAADQASLFKPFARTQDANRRHIEGTGLGLALVKSLIEEHGGRVELSSAPDEGATFTLVFPPSSVIAAIAPRRAAQPA